jgi:hypothetical protein
LENTHAALALLLLLEDAVVVVVVAAMVQLCIVCVFVLQKWFVCAVCGS